ncbi:hypothetical protein E2C01_101238 [Portunus trituberculatus]|uniref:Uncharacterized protein n=1 Tax=Portunus trituberculatus TaxID=210409 RepID=A0A5B7K923_PORTR|nr:hypothetical protein [Portunus trituberculatus]
MCITPSGEEGVGFGACWGIGKEVQRCRGPLGGVGLYPVQLPVQPFHYYSTSSTPLLSAFHSSTLKKHRSASKLHLHSFPRIPSYNHSTTRDKSTTTTSTSPSTASPRQQRLHMSPFKNSPPNEGVKRCIVGGAGDAWAGLGCSREEKEEEEEEEKEA